MEIIFRWIGKYCRKPKVLMTVFLCGLLCQVFLEGTIRYVPSTIGTKSGSETIQSVIDAADSGDTIILMGDRYYITTQISITKGLTIQGIGRTATYLISKTLASPIVISSPATQVTMKNMTVLQYYIGSLSTNKVIAVSGLVSHVTFEDMQIGYCSIGIGFGDSTNPSSSYVDVKNCQFIYTGTLGLQASNYAIELYGGHSGTSYIRNNLFTPARDQSSSFIYLTGGASVTYTGTLNIMGNIQSASGLKYFYLQDKFSGVGSNFALTVTNNAFSAERGSILFSTDSSPPLDGFRRITVISNVIGSTNGKGVVAFDGIDPNPLPSPPTPSVHVLTSGDPYSILSVAGNRLAVSSITDLADFSQAASSSGDAIGYNFFVYYPF